MNTTGSASITKTIVSSVSAIITTGKSTGNMSTNSSLIAVIIAVIATVYALLLILLNLQQICQMIYSFWQTLREWWTNKLPSQRILNSVSDNNKKLLVFVRDLYLQPGTLLLSRDGVNGSFGHVPNINEVWPRVEGIGLSKILNVLGQNDKTKQIEIVEMGKDIGLWNENLIVLGAQTQKCFDFYAKMNNVAYEINRNDILNKETGQAIQRQQGYGYGIILKCKNPFVKNGNGYGFLIGGYGVLGTEAASYYFSENLALLGREFGKACFGIIIRASITAGAQSVERVIKYDIKFDKS